MRQQDALWIGAIAVVFAPALLVLARVWASTDHYSHGFLVPLVAAWMFHAQRRGLPPAGEHAGGLVWIGAASLLYAAGLLRVDATLQGLALVAAIAGYVHWRHGGAGLRRVALPVAFLLFMVPIPPAWLNPVIAGLQLAVSSAAVEVLHAAGFSVLREGNVVLLPGDERLFVSEACSGITSIVTLVPLAVVLAWFTQRSLWRRAGLVLAVVPIAMLGNGVRVLATVAGARAWGAETVTGGALHDAAGLLTFVLSCLLLIGLGAVLRAEAGAPEAGDARPEAPAR